jgi:hypothetical protein
LAFAALFTQCEKESTMKLVEMIGDAFRNVLIDVGVDTDGDEEISVTEAEAVTYLGVSDENISDMTGIEAFVNLNSLYCCSNQITTLDVSNNTELEILELRYMHTLNEVCVWTMPFPPERVEVDTIGSPNVYFTSECSK